MQIPDQRKEKTIMGGFRGPEQTKPERLVFEKKMIPAIEHGMGDGETSAELFNCMQVKKVFSDDPEDKEDNISIVRNDQIRKDRMGAAAATADDPCHLDPMINGSALDEIDQISLIRSMERAGMNGMAERTCLHFRTEVGHKGIEQRF